MYSAVPVSAFLLLPPEISEFEIHQIIRGNQPTVDADLHSQNRKRELPSPLSPSRMTP